MKPIHEGSSIGIGNRSVCLSAEDTAERVGEIHAEWDQAAVVERFIMFRCPADIESELEADLIETAKAAFRITGCRDWARIDLRLDEEGRVHVLEVNALPGVLPDRP